MSLMRNFSILLFTLCLLLSTNAAYSQVTAEWLKTRRDSAIDLTARAKELSSQASALLVEARDKSRLKNEIDLSALSKTTTAPAAAHLAALNETAKKTPYSLEIRESVDRSNAEHPRRIVAPESQAVLNNYNELLARYKAALAAYVQHRQSVQEHAAEFHAQAQQSNTAPPPLMAVPAFRMLQVQAQDACAELQQTEAALHQLETELFDVIQGLVQNRKTMDPQQYATLWTQTESKTATLQRGVNAFNRGLIQKQETIQSNMHDATSQAMRDGDYVESQKVFGEHERTTGLLHQELKHANEHATIVIQFMNQLQTISPYAKSTTDGSQSGGFQFVQDDQSLAAEFEQVQQLYKQVQEAAPKFH